MSTTDYDQYAEDHQCLLVLIKSIGPQIDGEFFAKIYDRIIQNFQFKIRDKNDESFERTIRIRFRQSYSTENNDWGDFQAHRKVLGLVTVARSFNDDEIEPLTELHNTIRHTYASTLFDSRCFLIRSASTESTPPETESSNSTLSDSNINVPEGELDAASEEPPQTKLGVGGEQEECGLFDSLGQQLLIANDQRTSFATRINRSSSSSSLSASKEPVPSPPETPTTETSTPTFGDEGDVQGVEGSPTSLPFLQVPSVLPPFGDPRHRTHSRNKSLDSRILPLVDPENLSPTKSSSSGNLIVKKSNSGNFDHWASSTDGSATSLAKSSSECIEYENDQSVLDSIDAKVKEFLYNLFWVLEAKRVARAREISEKIPLLLAPCEVKDIIGLDTDSKNFRRKCLGRMQKHVGDLSMQAGLPREALFYFNNAMDQLKSANDKLWHASAIEAYCSCAMILCYPTRFEHIHLLRKRFRFEDSLFDDLIRRCDYEAARTELGDNSRKLSAKIFGVHESVLVDKVVAKSILIPDLYYEKYKEAVSLYALYHHASVIEFECSLKAARTLMFLKQNLQASDFLQNAVFTVFEQSLEQQIERLLKISQLYEQMKFYRKAAFYKRSAAVKCVKAKQTKSLENCYFLLLAASYGYGLNLNPIEYDRDIQKNIYNWSKIHVQLLQEMFTLAERMKNPTLAMRHLSFMLQCLFNYITPTQREQYAIKLSELSSRCGEGSPIALTLANSLVIPSVNFTKFPTLFFFKVEPLSLYLRPFLIESDEPEEEEPEESSGPFIYSALQHNKVKAVVIKGQPTVNRVPLFWCQDTLGKITINLHNFLPIDMRISSIMALTDGLAYEPNHDTVLKIKAGSTLENVALSGIPRATGFLDVLGYRVHALGLKSDCKLGDVPTAKQLKLPTIFQIQVTPTLPLMSAEILESSTQSQQQDSCSRIVGQEFHVSNATKISIFSGERRKFQVQLLNVSPDERELIEHCQVSVIFPDGEPKNSLVKVIWAQAQVDQQLPFSDKLLFDVELEVNDGFMVSAPSNLSRNSSSALMRNSSFRDKVLGSSRLASFINELQIKKLQNAGSEEPTSLQSANGEILLNSEFFKSKFVEFYLKLEYSGGDALTAGFCRKTAVCVNLEVKPSALITHWDVLAAEQPEECYIVFDIFNATQTEMNLHYADGKDILVESQDKCRIPVPILRCSLEEIALKFKNILKQEEQQTVLLEECRAHMRRQIDLKWSFLGGSDNSGFVSIHQVPFSNEMLRMLLTPLIQSDVFFNNQKHSSSSGEVELKLGEQLLIRVILTSQSSSKLDQLRLFASTYQDYHLNSKKTSHNMSDRILVNGTDQIVIEELEPKQSFEHEFGYIFLYPGVYRLNLCCLPDSEFLNLSSSNGIVSTELLDNYSLSCSTAASSVSTYLQTFEINIFLNFNQFTHLMNTEQNEEVEEQLQQDSSTDCLPMNSDTDLNEPSLPLIYPKSEEFVPKIFSGPIWKHQVQAKTPKFMVKYKNVALSCSSSGESPLKSDTFQNKKGRTVERTEAGRLKMEQPFKMLVDVWNILTPRSFITELDRYVTRKLPEYIVANYGNDALKKVIDELVLDDRKQSQKWPQFPQIVITDNRDVTVKSISANLVYRHVNDISKRIFQEIIDRIWDKGYETKELAPPLYDDVLPAFKQWSGPPFFVKIYSLATGHKPYQKRFLDASQFGTAENQFLIKDNFNSQNHYNSLLFQQIVSALDERVPKNLFYLTASLSRANSALKAGLTPVLLIRDEKSSLWGRNEEIDKFIVIKDLRDLEFFEFGTGRTMCC